MNRGLVLAGLGLLLLTVRIPWAGADLTPDLVGLALLLLAGRALGSRTLVVGAALAVPLHLVGYGGLLSWVHESVYAWWYAAAAGSLVAEGVITLAVLGALRRAHPATLRRGWVGVAVTGAATAYAIGVVVSAALLVLADPGGYVGGTGLAVLLPLVDLAQLTVAVTALLLAGCPSLAPASNAEGRPRRSGSAPRVR